MEYDLNGDEQIFFQKEEHKQYSDDIGTHYQHYIPLRPNLIHWHYLSCVWQKIHRNV